MQVEAKQFKHNKIARSICDHVGRLTIQADTLADAEALCAFAAVFLDHRGNYQDLLRRFVASDVSRLTVENDKLRKGINQAMERLDRTGINLRSEVYKLLKQSLE